MIRFLQFHLRSLFLLVTVCAVALAMGLHMMAAYRERQIIRLVDKSITELNLVEATHQAEQDLFFLREVVLRTTDLSPAARIDLEKRLEAALSATRSCIASLDAERQEREEIKGAYATP